MDHCDARIRARYIAGKVFGHMVAGKVSNAWAAWVVFTRFHNAEEKATAHAVEVLAHVTSIEALRRETVREKEERRRVQVEAAEKHAATIETMRLQTEVYEQQVGKCVYMFILYIMLKMIC